MKKLIIASNNSKKIKEIKNVMRGVNLKVVSLSDEGINIDVEEDGKTFKDNAVKKAQAIYDYLIKKGEDDFIVLADDSGLEVEYLNGNPGIYSARYAGEHGNDKKNNDKLLKNLSGVEWSNRKARFVCQLAIIDAENRCENITGYAEGYILENSTGADGFGYDPIFFYPELEKTFAEISMEEKNKISHRAKALIQFKNIIGKYL